VAKTAFRAATHSVPLLRGTSVRPLYATSAGMPRDDAADLVRHMAGRYRIPDALRRADTLARTGRPARDPATLSQLPQQCAHCGRRGRSNRWHACRSAATLLARDPLALRGTDGGPHGAQRQSPQVLRRAVGLGGEYSTKVPQQVQIWRDAEGRSGTVTCGYGRWWTCCLLFASRGSGVRVPLAPQVRSVIRTAKPIF
jgi:hypothetical protein